MLPISTFQKPKKRLSIMKMTHPITSKPSRLPSRLQLKTALTLRSFDIKWAKVVYTNGRATVLPEGTTAGYRFIHRRQHRGRANIAVIWQFGANINVKKAGELPRRYWLCKICHLQRRYVNSFFLLNGSPRNPASPLCLPQD